MLHPAQAHPLKVPGIAAGGVGAATVVLRSWRLVSLGGMLSAILTADRSAWCR